MALSLSDLRARPDDRELLEVYADWLESRGDPRGELIAVQLAEQRCLIAAEFEEARTRAIELIEAHPELCPEASLDCADRKLWATWAGGFIRRLELVFDEQHNEIEGGGAPLLARILAHPSLALLDQLLIRVDLRDAFGSDARAEAHAALELVREGLAARLAEPGPKPALSVSLWTYRVPSPEARDRLRGLLPGLRATWYSTDITVIPPPRGSIATLIEGDLAELPFGAGRFDLVWLDARGSSRDMFGVRPTEIGWFGTTQPGLRVGVGHMAARGTLARPDPVAQRRIAGLLDGLAARLDTEASESNPLAPRPLCWPRPERVDSNEVAATLRERWALDPSTSIAIELARSGLEWWWIEERCEDEPWSGLCGLSDEQLLVLGRTAS